MDEGSEDGATRIDAEIRKLRLEQCIEELSARHRQIVILHHFENLQLKEIATRLGEKPPTVRSWHRQARESLKKCLTLKGIE